MRNAQARPHDRMLGAALVRHLALISRARTTVECQPQGLFLLWLAYMGLLLGGAWLLAQRGVWALLLQADPTGLTLSIVVVFVLASVWVGRRAWLLGWQHQALAVFQGTAVSHASEGVWVLRYWREHQALDPHTARELLAERCHGPQEMGWWVNGILIKLGLLGKVIGFSILAFELGQMEGFDPTQTAQLLKSLTGGLGVALLTTMAGLAANMLLGVQLMRLDRFADGLMSEILIWRLDAIEEGG
jgi:hypothetical protein